MAGVILTCAKQLGVKLRWGGDWDGDGNRLNNKFNDLAHFELVD
jgi:peptidoglycan L-alanyl-D-glutamate endopeptidase CwlK